MHIIIDANNIAHRAKHVNGSLDDGIIFGFLNQVLTLSKILDCPNFIFCWDSRQSYRKILYPEYKANRVKNNLTDEDFDAFQQFKRLQSEILFSLGFKNVFMQIGYEADDLLAVIVKNFPREYIIVSSDEDLYQLLGYASIYQPIKKKIVTQGSFEREYCITPSEWPTVKALAGCSSDNVIGMAGVGEKTAIKFLNKTLKPGKTFDKVSSEHKSMIEKNLPLVKLPFIGPKPIQITLRDESLYEMDFIDTFTKLGFNSFLSDKKMETWIERLNLIEGRE